jgi:fermentation-respiration switch protein FrsA (DUF1100 family)
VRRPLAVVLVVLLALAALVVGVRQVLYVKTEHAGFDPQPPGRERPSDLAMAYRALTIPSAEHQLDAWWIPAAGADSGAVILFHGNAETISDWLAAARLLHAHHLDVMLFDYAGYGRSTGTPSVAAVIQDGVSALRAFERLAPPGVRRTGAGLSLGSGVLMEAAALEPRALDAIALLEPFSSGRAAAVQLKLLPGWLAPLMPDAFDNVRLARALSVPLLVVHSRADDRFPVAFAEEIAGAARARRLVVLDGYAHAAARQHPDERYWAAVVALAQGRSE